MYTCKDMSVNILTMKYCVVYELRIQLSATLEKIQTISEQISSRLNRDCQCSFSAAYVTAAQLSCDPQENTDVIFRARLSSTSEVSSADFIILLQEWVTSGRAAIAVEHIQLDVDPMCDVLLQSFSDSICSSIIVTSEVPTTPVVDTEKSSSTLSIVGPIVGAIVGGVILILVVIFAIQIFNHHCRRLGQYEFRSVYFLV